MERKSIGMLIAALRRANGLTQKQLADRLGVSDKAVSRWERDESLPDLTLLPVIADLFHITVDELLRGECREQQSGALAQGLVILAYDDFHDKNTPCFRRLASIFAWLVRS